MIGRTYRVIRGTNPPKGKRQSIIEATGLSWDEASVLCEKLRIAEAEKKPLETSWTRDVFCRELEPSPVPASGGKEE